MAKKKKKSISASKTRKGKPAKRQKTNSRDKVFQKEILAFMKANRNHSFTSKQVGTATGLWSEVGVSKLRSLMQRLADSGKLEPLDKGKYRYLKHEKLIVGQLEVTRKGSGYILQDVGDDIYVRPQELGKALNGDIVKARIIKKRKSGQPEGKIADIVQRNKTEFVGTVEEGLPGTYFFLPDDPRISTDFYIPGKQLNGAKDGQKVLLRMTNWKRKSPEGEVLEVLGDAGEHNTEMHAILFQYGFNPAFPPEVEKEARNIPEQLLDREIKRRRDMRNTVTLTIDPADAKDFDDALSFQVLENGHFEVGVHIADVSYYVRPDTYLDREAFKRATSVYLVDRTVPMLPEKLSNGVCSLRPHEDKFTYSAIFEMDAQAKILKQWIGRTVIHSDHRFSYEEAQENIVGTQNGPYAEILKQLNALALKLREKRMKQGSIEFDTEEVRFVLDENGKPVSVKRKERFDAHKLIEDFMLLANRKVAAYIAKLFDNPPLPGIYRVHDRPNTEKLGVLQNFVKQFGYESNLAEARNVSQPLNELLKEVQGKPEQNVIETLAVRSMAKAEYTTQNLGHFGLGFEFYTHFTSPIRRYPDLLIHRILYKYQNKEYNENPVVLEEQCKHCSKRERTAAEAERASIKYKQVEFLEDKVGKEYDGIISGVIESGLFVELEENLCEGMVHIKSLEDDYYSYEADMYQLVGYDTGTTYRIGDKVRVEIAGADLKRRTIDMKMVGKKER
ncbi:MAG: ribonuclease R [Bacteroidota bacterium]